MFVPFLSFGKTFQENPLTKAIQLFDKEKYTEAEILFKKLLDERPDDFMVNYFYGACRTENGHYSDKDLYYLEKASKEVTPLNIDYYFGVQYHAKNQWEKALVFYKRYKTGASVNDQEKVNLSLKIDQCVNKINPFGAYETVEKTDDTVVHVITETGVAAVSVENLTIAEQALYVKNDSTLQITGPEQNTESGQKTEENPKVEIIKSKPVEEQIKFNINSEITYITVSNFKTEEGETYFKEGNLKQTELVEILKETEKLREKYKASKSRSERDSIGQQILALESQTYELNSVAYQLFLKSKTAENGYWQNTTPEETENFIRGLNAAAQEQSNKSSIKTESVSAPPELIITPKITDNEEIKPPAPKAKPSGVTYKIQLGAYSRGIPNNMKSVFNKISVIRKVENYTDANGVVVYTTGNLTSYEDAVVMQNQIRQEGIKDPLIAAYMNEKRITLEQAKEMEKKK